MPLKEKYMVKTVLGNTDLELEADSGESFLVKDILIYDPATNYLTVKIDRVTVGYFRVGGSLGSHLPFLVGRSEHAHDWKTSTTAAADQTSFAGLLNAGATEIAAKMIGNLSADTLYRRAGNLAAVPMVGMKSILGLLFGLKLFKGYPIAEGQKMTFSGVKQATAIQIVVYEIWDAGDQTKDKENGSEAKEYLFINYGNTGGNVNKTGDSIYNTAQSPAEFPDFPYGKNVPSGFEIDLLGILGSDFAPKENDGTDYCYTKFLKLIRERVTLFDEDKNGILFWSNFATALGNMDMVGEGQSLIGNYSDKDMRMPLLFPTPLTFKPGEELAVYLTSVKGGTGQNIATDEHEIGLIEKARKL